MRWLAAANGRQVPATWRRGWDSNPRYGKTVNRISNPAHSTTLPPLRYFKRAGGRGGPSGAYVRPILGLTLRACAQGQLRCPSSLPANLSTTLPPLQKGTVSKGAHDKAAAANTQPWTPCGAYQAPAGERRDRQRLDRQAGDTLWRTGRARDSSRRCAPPGSRASGCAYTRIPRPAARSTRQNRRAAPTGQARRADRALPATWVRK
jgi:hypothetical protein